MITMRQQTSRRTGTYWNSFITTTTTTTPTSPSFKNSTTSFVTIVVIMLSLLRTSFFSSALSTMTTSSSSSSSSSVSAASASAAGEILANHIVGTGGSSSPQQQQQQHQQQAQRRQTQTLIRLRLATRTDVPSIQRCNLACLPENYNSQFYCSHLRQWPEFALVAEAVETTTTTTTTMPATMMSEEEEFRDEENSGSQQQQQMFRPTKSSSPPQPSSSYPGGGRGGFGGYVGFGNSGGGIGGGEPKIVAYVLGKVETRPVIEYDDPFGGMSSGSSPRRGAPYHVSNGGRRRHTGQFETLGHVTSLAVHHDFRRLGLAKALMEQLQTHMQHYHVGGPGGGPGGGGGPVRSCGLHVRVSNEAAFKLYSNDGYEIESVLPHYYQDGEEAYYMRKMLPPPPIDDRQWQRRRRSSPYTPFDNPLFFGNSYRNKIWRHGPEDLRLPRIHCAIDHQEDEQQLQTSYELRSPPASSGNSEEMLMGSM